MLCCLARGSLRLQSPYRCTHRCPGIGGGIWAPGYVANFASNLHLGVCAVPYPRHLPRPDLSSTRSTQRDSLTGGSDIPIRLCYHTSSMATSGHSPRTGLTIRVLRLLGDNTMAYMTARSVYLSIYLCHLIHAPFTPVISALSTSLLSASTFRLAFVQWG